MKNVKISEDAIVNIMLEKKYSIYNRKAVNNETVEFPDGEDLMFSDEEYKTHSSK